jgi:hypothetical protein
MPLENWLPVQFHPAPAHPSNGIAIGDCGIVTRASGLSINDGEKKKNFTRR